MQNLLQWRSAVVFLCILSYHSSFSQSPDSLLSFNYLKKLSIDELMNVEVTSVTKHSQKLIQSASAIQVISQKDIQQSGAKTLAEALRLAPNLQVAQVNSSQWAISSRGFNNVLANKLLVLVDGRTVYTPLYAGVFWDVQNLVLEDIDRIEVISGPGGALWGANSVNGTINIITKNSKETKGLFVEGAAGTHLPGLGSVRYGAQLNERLSFRVFGTGFKMGNTQLADGADAEDEWPMGKGGFRLDWEASKNSQVSLQANMYSGRPNPDAAETSVVAKGENATVRWNHRFSEKTTFQLQAYYDHTWRDFGNEFTEDLKTWDIDLQNRHQFAKGHALTYGTNFRLMDHKVTNLDLFEFLPEKKKLYLYSLFIQDEIALIRERLLLTVGAKIEHNSYTGFEYQPSGRLSFKPAKNHTIWAAVSRAVRTPARIDRDFFLYINRSLPLITGSDSFKTAALVAYELGWRVQPLENLSVSLSAFYNIYSDLRSAEPGPPPFNIPIMFANGVEGNTYGLELAASQQVNNWWNLRFGYTFIEKNLRVKAESKDLNAGTEESNDPAHQLMLQSKMDLPGRLALGTVIRYIDKLPEPYVRGYAEMDLRISWNLNKMVELSIVGQNLFNNRHAEFLPTSPSPRELERSMYGKATFRL